MNNILSIEGFMFENENIFNSNQNHFTKKQIIESLEYLNLVDDKLLEAWYNTVLDFAALLPGIGSVAEGINLVSYAKQGEYLLAGLCAIGLIPIFGQYIGAGGSILVKSLERGMGLGKGLIKPLINLIAKFFPKITAFLKSSKFLTKFSGISPFIGKILGALRSFVIKGGGKIMDIVKNPSKIKSLRNTATEVKGVVKITDWIRGQTSSENTRKIPVPKEAYSNYQGGELKNIRPYSDTEISQAEMAQNWDMYLS